jgi:4-amino-4-deoxychorismate lyase
MNAPDVILVNGRPTQGISPLDRGLHFGDGLFETISCRRGRPRFLALHMDRLLQGCERLQIDLGPVETIRAEVEQLAHRTDASIVKLIMTRGDALARGYAPTGKERATRITLRYPWPIEESGSWHAGVRAGVASMRLGENPALAGMKHLSRLEQVLAQAERDTRQLRELLLLSSSGHLVCGTTTNVFLVREGKLQTPRLDRCGVAGIMRRVIIREARRAGIGAEERELAILDVDQAEEIFLTNARIGIWPVNALETRELGVGPVTQRLQAAIEPMLEEPVDA